MRRYQRSMPQLRAPKLCETNCRYRCRVSVLPCELAGVGVALVIQAQRGLEVTRITRTRDCILIGVGFTSFGLRQLSKCFGVCKWGAMRTEGYSLLIAGSDKKLQDIWRRGARHFRHI